MVLTLAQIIAEANVRVPNGFDDAQKIVYLNEINAEFFELVKIPLTATFTTTGTGSYTLTPTDIRSKNIDKVLVGTRYHASMLYGDLLPGRTTWEFNETTRRLTITPDPINGEKGIVRYHRTASTSFVSGALTAYPDAPSEYHWVYILGLAERIAKAMDDVVKANNFGQDYRGALTVAQANYQR